MNENFRDNNGQFAGEEDRIIAREKIDMVLDLWFKDKLEREDIQEKTGLSLGTIGAILRGDIFYPHGN